MHPAYSVILFTTASGAGYGLLFWLAVMAFAGALPADRWLGVMGLGLAVLLITAGLLASTFHLGHPERAWRAFSQWRTSWLSREGVLAVLTYVPAGLFGLGWVMLETADGWVGLTGLIAALLAMLTVWCTGMIYQSLPTITAWSHPLVAPIYVVLALATGAALTVLIMNGFGRTSPRLALITAALILIGWVLKRCYWSQIDAAKRCITPARAIGLEAFGSVRPLEPPHTGRNFVMREMGYTVARKHAKRLRDLVQTFGFGVALVATVLVALTGGLLAAMLSLIAVMALGFGVVVERWLFFAQAQHIVSTYYGADSP